MKIRWYREKLSSYVGRRLFFILFLGGFMKNLEKTYNPKDFEEKIYKKYYDLKTLCNG